MKRNPDMVNWPTVFRSSGLVERICPHDCGHPDPDFIKTLRETNPEAAKLLAIHGCDGCCCVPEEGDEDERS